MLDRRIYKVGFPNGGVGEFLAKTIAESLYEKLDNKGYQYNFLEEIIGHRKLDDAVDIKYSF